MLQQQTVSELRQGKNVRPLNCGVMQLHYFANFCEECVSVNVHTGIEVCVCFKMQNHLFKSTGCFLAATQKEEQKEQGIWGGVIRDEVCRDREWCG